MTRLKKDWREDVVNRAENLALRYGGEAKSVALDTIANRRSIRSVVFRPLLIAGGLALRDDGFVVYVKSDRKWADTYHRDFVLNGGRSLPPRLRFTIAHEVVHTLLYDLQASPPRARLKANNHETFVKLEATCNEGAGHLLLPKNRMQSLLSSESFFQPEFIRSFARETGASIATVIVRCSQEDWGILQGAIATVVLRNNRAVVEESARSRLAKGFLADLERGAELSPPIADGIQKCHCGSLQEEKRLERSTTLISAPTTTRWLQVSRDPARWLISIELNEYPTTTLRRSCD